MIAKAQSILIAGAGIAGLSAALAFARRGADVQIFERAEKLEEVGAGLQLSPNATRFLSRIGVLDELMETAVEPDAIVLRRADTLREIGRVPLGQAARARWGSPYLVSHRADLQRALLNAVARQSSIKLSTNAPVSDIDLESDAPRIAVGRHDGERDVSGRLIVGADGVWSTIRALSGKVGESRFVGQIAWRRTMATDSPAAQALLAACPGRCVTAFLHPGFHMIAYPVRGGKAINLAAFTPTRVEMSTGWSHEGQTSKLQKAMYGTAPAVAALATDGDWLAWPIHVADLDAPWSAPVGLALIGDAAHAMTPFAAQGAAMAIEDAETLAARTVDTPDLAAALHTWTVERRRRVLKVARRGAFNHFAWHAWGPAATARDLVLKMRSPESLMADMDWLYGWDGPI
ncbi:MULTISPECIES: FAD-dependent monooxygenase [Mesorhizobium]|uniref:Salicylate hydroxylase n=1 Tax=Mesorhizobium denitrificans TaxID=2294114 RepID=A0A371XIK1_9HYPH|nr:MULTISPECIES: FAD-dependent monooxygenase [Mesorhizobium]RFC69056.1 salicylate hydroxylase [Mesorhizobium denitrificans]